MREWLIHRMQHERNGHSTTVAAANETVGAASDSMTETTRLLAVEERFSSVEEIAMDTLSASCNAQPSAANELQLTDDDDDDAIIELN